jgi:hypothetical protein
MQPETVAVLSAFAATGAAIAAIAIALVQLYVGKKQASAALLSAKAATLSAENAGRHAVAIFRQKWIDTLRDPDVDKRVEMDPQLVAAARAILKVEWEKVKAELQPPKSA